MNLQKGKEQYLANIECTTLSSLYILLNLICMQPLEVGFISELNLHCVSKALYEAWYIVGTQKILS